MEKQWKTTTAREGGITTTALEEISEPQNREQIAALAYEFWKARGCPVGTPDEDWFRAERKIAASMRIDENEVGSRDSAEQSIDAKEADSPVLRFPVRCELFQVSHRRVSRRTA